MTADPYAEARRHASVLKDVVREARDAYEETGTVPEHLWRLADTALDSMIESMPADTRAEARR